MAPMERGEPVSPVHMKPYNQEIIAMAIDVRTDEDDPFFADIIVLIGSELYLFSVSENARGIPFKPLTD